MLQAVLKVNLDFEGYPEVVDELELTLIYLNSLLDAEVVSLTYEINDALFAFYERELSKVLKLVRHRILIFSSGRQLVDYGWIYPINVMPDDEQFAVNILDRWDCFVLSYLSDENSNELDVLLNNFWRIAG